ncbi:MAG: hypothetical protein IT457_15840 [Planctomycetes bacterium]|nr:hypothetical protein [Planctomycetota bacterium]
MKPVPLALDGLPPFAVPLRYFLTAPVFGVLAGALLLVEGEAAVATRWSPAMLALTHLLTLGWLAMVIVGALYQVVPVLVGRALPRTTRIAPLVHGGLTLGTAALAAGFLFTSRTASILGMTALVVAFGIFLPALALRVLARGRGGDAIFTLRFAVLSMLATVSLGVAIASGFAWPELGLAARVWTDTHVRFGLLGFVFLLIAGVSFQVVPMFHVTPPFPPLLTRTLGPLVFLALLVRAIASSPSVALSANVLLALGCAAHAFALLAVLARRRRRREDATVRAWQIAALALLVATVTTLVIPSHDAILPALLFLLGFASTVVLGMLAKVVPFLAFTHLQRRVLRTPAAIPLLPTMDGFISPRAAGAQLVVHLVAVLGAVVAAHEPRFVRLAGAALVLDFAVLEGLVLVAALRYRRADAAIGRVIARPGGLDHAVAPVLPPE